MNLYKSRLNLVQNNGLGKNKGFTLAEVLLVITIIGIIASYTIPGMINSINNQQLKTAWKKKYSEVAQATNLIIMDRENMIGISTADGHEELRNLYKEKMKTVKDCTWSDSEGNCWHIDNEWYSAAGAPLTNGAISLGKTSVLSDGAFITFDEVSTACTYANSSWIGNYSICAWIYVDINGFKGPNTMDKDIFQILVTSNGIKAVGYYGDNRALAHGALQLLQ